MVKQLLIVALVLVASSATAQSWNSNVEALSVSVATDAPVYGANETVQVRVTIANPTDSLAVLEGVPGCIASFEIDEYDSREWTACTLLSWPIEFPPHSSLTTVWDLNLTDLGLARRQGVRQLVGRAWVGMPDTTTFVAESALGGRLAFGSVQGLTHSDFASLRDSLGAEVLYESTFGSDGVWAVWRVTGVSVDSVVSRYATDPRFYTLEADRWLVSEEVFVAADDAHVGPVFELVAFPNPASETLELAIRSRRPEHVRLEVFDTRGRRVYERDRVQGVEQIDVHDWPPGIYTARIHTRDANSALRFTIVR